MDLVVLLLNLIIFLPAAGALVLLLIPRAADEGIKIFSQAITVVVFCLTIGVWIQFESGQPEMQWLTPVAWIPSFNINYTLGMDGVSFPLVLLTAFISMLAMGASWTIDKNVKAYCILFLLLETGMLGVFLALDFFLFYVFWEVMLLPMYFLIGVWGGPRREYAAIKFFLYTLVGSVLMLIAILILYFNSDVTQLSPQRLFDAGVLRPYLQPAEPTAQQLAMAQKKLLEAIEAGERSVHTFNVLALQQMGQHTELFAAPLLGGKSLQWWSFILLFIGFVIKVPSVPVHTWLPDAHVEAPTPISMILAGVLLKMGGYGIIRMCYPICPAAGYELAWFVCLVGVVSMVYGAFAALAQSDFKRLVAYSSVSHMGYVVLGMGVWSVGAWSEAPEVYNPYYWSMGMNGAMFQMIAHGISSAGMFFMVGVVYDRVHHRDLNEFGGLFGKMPAYSGLAIVIFFAGLGLPGLCGFIGEVFVTLSVWNFNRTLAVISAAVVILTAGYILWTIQRVYLGPEYRGPHGEALTPISIRELAIASPLAVMAVVLGVYPALILNPMEPSVTQVTRNLAAWTEQYENRLEEGSPEETPAPTKVAVKP